jgi:hypothetical protein
MMDVDAPVPAEVLEKIGGLPGVFKTRVIK